MNLGFLLFFDPSKHLQDDAREKVLNLLLNAECHELGEGEKFQLVTGSPYLHIGSRHIPTKAYTDVCLKDAMVDELLKRIYPTTCHYVKFCLIDKNKQAYSQALGAQNNYLSTLRTMPISWYFSTHDETTRRRNYGNTQSYRRGKISYHRDKWMMEYFNRQEKFPQRPAIHQVQPVSFWLERHFHGIDERPDGFPEV